MAKKIDPTILRGVHDLVSSDQTSTRFTGASGTLPRRIWLFKTTKECFTYLLAVVALDGHRRHVLPAKPVYDLDDGLRLEVIGRHDSAEVLEPALVR